MSDLFRFGLSYGPKIIHDFLHGARIGDEHSTRDLHENIALIQAVVRFFQLKNHSALALVPYGEALSCLPSLMGQLICESLGKSVSNDSKRLMRSPAPYLMHGVGPDAQHTFSSRYIKVSILFRLNLFMRYQGRIINAIY